ncbi:hypothetical protein [Sphingobacterium sp. SGR-19]|uniref:hypothetical protein n=1 Tax=Sphingobacterium sp. SGR-19 TaxID=2710886 RepID=UPI0013EA2771|nr:hypothetical protein [Sphingobacterium sp. SGR-19]NGM64916.1 hypothetical protein [Sphingobacterium sp. SGR-19]
MKKLLFALLSISLLWTSCSKGKEDCDPDDEESPCYLIVGVGDKLLMTELKVNGKINSRYEYDQQNRAIVMHVYDNDGTSSPIKFYYGGDNIVKVEYLSGGELVMTEEYIYGSGDKPTSGVLKDRDGKTDVRIEFTYTKNEVRETSFDMEGNMADYHIYRFDDKGNPTTSIINASGNMGFTTTLTHGDYDDHPTVMTHRLWHWKIGAVNNARSFSSITQMTGGGTINSVDQIWKFTYNAAGYPMKAEAYDRQTDVLMETQTYTYIKAN